MELVKQNQKAIEKIREAYFAALEDLQGTEAETDGSIKYSAKDTGLSEERLSKYEEYVNDTLDGNEVDEWFGLAPVSDKLVDDLRKQGADISGFNHRIRRNDIVHINRNHGTDVEGAYGVTTGDLWAIPYIVRNYTDVRVRFKDGQHYGVVYKLDHVDTTYYVEGHVIREKVNYLQGVQMIKVPLGEVPSIYEDVYQKKAPLNIPIRHLQKKRCSREVRPRRPKGKCFCEQYSRPWN